MRKPLIELIAESSPVDWKRIEEAMVLLARRINGDLDASAIHPAVKLMVHGSAVEWVNTYVSGPWSSDADGNIWVPGGFRECYSRLVLTGSSSEDHWDGATAGALAVNLGSPVPLNVGTCYIDSIAARVKRGDVAPAREPPGSIIFSSGGVTIDSLALPLDRSGDVDGWVTVGKKIHPHVALNSGPIIAYVFRYGEAVDEPVRMVCSAEVLVPHHDGSV